MRYIQTKQQTVIIYVLHSMISVTSNYSWQLNLRGMVTAD